jgi:hypothetical protein
MKNLFNKITLELMLDVCLFVFVGAVGCYLYLQLIEALCK